MRCFRLNSLLVLLALAAGLLAPACSADPTPTPLPTPIPSPSPTSSLHADVHLERNFFSADLPVSTTVFLSGFLEGESVEVALKASDGSTSELGTVTAQGRDGLASVDVRHDGLAAGTYVIHAIGDGGSKASFALHVK